MNIIHNERKQDADPRHLAHLYAQHVSDDNGQILARVWESPEFKEAFDYKGGYEK